MGSSLVCKIRRRTRNVRTRLRGHRAGGIIRHVRRTTIAEALLACFVVALVTRLAGQRVTVVLVFGILAIVLWFGATESLKKRRRSHNSRNTIGALIPQVAVEPAVEGNLIRVRVRNQGADDNFQADVTDVWCCEDSSEFECRKPWSVKWQEREGTQRTILHRNEAFLEVAEYVRPNWFRLQGPDGDVTIELARLSETNGELLRPAVVTLCISNASGSSLEHRLYVGLDGSRRVVGNSPRSAAAECLTREQDPGFVVYIPPAGVEVLHDSHGAAQFVPPLFGPVELVVVNLEESRVFEAEVIKIEGASVDESPPWSIRWHGDGGQRREIRRGGSAILDLAEPVYMEQRYMFRTPQGERSASYQRSASGTNLLRAHVVVSPVDSTHSRSTTIEIRSMGGVVYAKLT